MQRPASLEIQESNCRETIASMNMDVAEDFVVGDAAKSGKSTLKRESLNFLVEAAKQRPKQFDFIVADDTSRVARHLADILKLHQVLKHHQVGLYFVSQKLDSRDPNFEMMLMFLGMQDQQYIERLGRSVLGGQRSSVLKGYYTGVAPFGYRTVRLYNPADPDNTSRANLLGTSLTIVESKAKTVRRIYDMYGAGVSIHRIAMILSDESVPAARKPRIGNLVSTWNSNLISRILRNEKYIGKHIWNRAKQYPDPETGKIDTRAKMESEFVHVDCPSWRIVSDVQWNRAQSRLAVVNDRTSARRVAGLNRGKSKDYLFSGLLWCGLCEGPIVITGGKGSEASYGCRLARYKRGCDNNLRIRADRFAASMIEALQKQLLSDNVIDHFIRSIQGEMVKEQDKLQQAALTFDRSTVMEAMKTNDQRIAKLVYLIDQMDERDMAALAGPLRLAQAERRELQEQLDARPTSDLPISLEAVRGKVKGYVGGLRELLLSDVTKSRALLQQYVGRLVLVPSLSANGPIYEVLGDLELYEPNSSARMLGVSSTAISQHSVDTTFRFVGLAIDPLFERDDENGPVLALALATDLAKLIQVHPEFQGHKFTSREWRSHLLADTGERDGYPHELISPKTMSWIMRVYGHTLGRFMEIDVDKDLHTGTKRYSLSVKKQRTLQLTNSAGFSNVPSQVEFMEAA